MGTPRLSTERRIRSSCGDFTTVHILKDTVHLWGLATVHIKKDTSSCGDSPPVHTERDTVQSWGLPDYPRKEGYGTVSEECSTPPVPSGVMKHCQSSLSPGSLLLFIKGQVRKECLWSLERSQLFRSLPYYRSTASSKASSPHIGYPLEVWIHS